MKYILTIDTEKKEVSANLDRPIFLCTGEESPMELIRRRQVLKEYESATLPDWLYDEVAIIQKNCNAKLPREVRRDSRHPLVG